MIGVASERQHRNRHDSRTPRAYQFARCPAAIHCGCPQSRTVGNRSKRFWRPEPTGQNAASSTSSRVRVARRSGYNGGMLRDGQFTLRSLLIATAFIAAACALVRYVVTSDEATGQLLALLPVPILICGADAEREARAKSDYLVYADAAGDIADFHSFRHLYVSTIVNSGAPIKVAQELARHSTPSLTVGRYTHARLHDVRSAVDSLPTAERPKSDEPEVLRATGTDDLRCTPESAQHSAQQSGREIVPFRASASNAMQNAMMSQPRCNSYDSAELCEPVQRDTMPGWRVSEWLAATLEMW
jgi:Phage integrase family